MELFGLFLNIILVTSFCHVLAAKSNDLLAITVATEPTDGFNRFMRSAKLANVTVTVLGMGRQWLGGDMKSTGGGHKINLLRAELEKHKKDAEKVILVTDSYDVVMTATSDELLQRFLDMEARVVFSAEAYCWPDTSLETQYPAISAGVPFLNSGGFIGFARELYGIVSAQEVADSDDDQLYYTRIYLDTKLRSRFNIKLDHTSQIFHNLHGAEESVEVLFGEDGAYLQHVEHGTVPGVVHGNGLSKLTLNMFSNYLAQSWHPQLGCTACLEDNRPLDESPVNLPPVCLAVFLKSATPFSEEFFDKLFELDYPKRKLSLYVYNSVDYHMEEVTLFLERHGHKYNDVGTVGPSGWVGEIETRNAAVDKCLESGAEYMFVVDATAHLDYDQTLKLLIKQNRDVVAPLLGRPYKAWSNFWGALSADGFYARSFDYMDIVANTARGVWNVPFISDCYLMKRSVLEDESTRPQYAVAQLDPDMAFCANMREAGKFMYVSNLANFGHLVSDIPFDTDHLHNEMWQLVENQWDWEQRYLHPEYKKALGQTEDAQVDVWSLYNPNDVEPLEIANFDTDVSIPVLDDDIRFDEFMREHGNLKTGKAGGPDGPCPDVFWFPVMSERFCVELINTMEHNGGWSDGSNQDKRLDGGYENVPTRDIHMKQVGYEKEWLWILKQYVRPLQEKVFVGYFNDPPQAIMNFVVRYRPDEQPFLRPHHDASTYTINLALNNPGDDYQGGGARFIRYDCAVRDSKKGWLLMHPGRLTHYHEGLPTTAGTRYIMVSFIDP